MEAAQQAEQWKIETNHMDLIDNCKVLFSSWILLVKSSKCSAASKAVVENTSVPFYLATEEKPLELNHNKDTRRMQWQAGLPSETPPRDSRH